MGRDLSYRKVGWPELNDKLPDFCEKCGVTDGYLSRHHREQKRWYDKYENQHKYNDYQHNIRLCTDCHKNLPPGALASDMLFRDKRG